MSLPSLRSLALFTLCAAPTFCALSFPAITNQPQSQVVAVGADATLELGATGNVTPLHIQWRSNGTNLPGATNASLTVTNVPLGDATFYSAVVSDAAGAVGSDTVFILASATPVATTGGAVRFANLAAGVDAPVPECDKPATDGQWVAQLYWGPENAVGPDGLAATGLPVPFGKGSSAGYFSGGIQNIPGTAPAQTVTLQVRMWRVSTGPTFEESTFRGMSSLLRVTLGGGGFPVPNLVGLQSPVWPPPLCSISGTQTVWTGASAELSFVPTSGCPSNSIQWMKDFTPVPGAVGSVVDIPITGIDPTGYYRGPDCGAIRVDVRFRPYFVTPRVANNRFTALVGGSIQNRLVIQSSTNLVDWVDELTTTSLTSLLPFESGATGDQKFFRALTD